MACGGCARRRLKQQAVSHEIAAQQEAERQAQRAAEELAARHATVEPALAADVPAAPESEKIPETPRRRRKNAG